MVFVKQFSVGYFVKCIAYEIKFGCSIWTFSSIFHKQTNKDPVFGKWTAILRETQINVVNTVLNLLSYHENLQSSFSRYLTDLKLHRTKLILSNSARHESVG